MRTSSTTPLPSPSNSDAAKANTPSAWDELPHRNFIGIDIKGARMWTGARQVCDEGLSNVAFLRTSIHLLPHFFAPGEVSEIWITFPDPQMKKVNKRLTGTHFLEIYRQVLAPGGIIHLKTDSPFLYAYTTGMISHNSLPLIAATDDLYHSPLAPPRYPPSPPTTSSNGSREGSRSNT